MKIKITKPGEWYKNLVGQEFEVDVVTRYIGTNYEVKNFREVHEKLFNEKPSGELIGMAIHIDHAEIIESTKQERDMVKNRRPDQFERFFKI